MDYQSRKEIVILNKSAEVSVVEQCKLLDLSRSSIYYEPEPLFSDEQLAILNQMD